MSDDIKFGKYLTQKELAEFLRDLADAVENGGQDQLACVEDFNKIKIGVKREFGQISLKAKIRLSDPCEVDEAGGTKEGADTPSPAKPKYKSLKKRMKSSFKVLVTMVHEGSVPPKEAVDSFLADSALMVTYPGYGDEYYKSYTNACQAFKEAYEAGDLDRMHQTVDALVHEKSRCHAKYD